MSNGSSDLGLLPVGKRGRIASVAGDDPVSVRLLELGLLPGEEVEVLGVAPLGDPIAVRIRGTRLAIRRRDAARIELQPAGGAGSPAQVLTPASAVT